MKKFIKVASSVLLAVVMLVASIMNVNAASDTISIGQASKVHHNYIANVTFSYKVTTDGRYLYCLDLHRNTASNVTARLVSNSSNIDGGLVHILKNGYPNKSITGDSDKDYYITQSAVWWYLDSTRGAGNLGNGFKKTGSDPYGLRKYVSNLVNEGIAHRYDSTAKAKTELVIKPASGDSLDLVNNYYVSSDIKAVSASNIGQYSVTLGNSLPGTMIVLNGKEFAYTGAFNVGVSDTFKVKVPATSVTTKSVDLDVHAYATGYDYYMAYEYQPTNSKMQNVALLEKTNDKVEATTKLHIDSSRLSVIKIDANTKKPLAGAKLVLKDSRGNVITSWVSSINAHIIRNLAEGTYTIEETEAPKGYILNKNKTVVNVTNKTTEITVNIENKPKEVVVNINKIDQDTNAPLAGAVLLVKDSNNKEIARFTTTESAYVLTNLENGTYTVQEVSAPSGYVTSNEIISFTIDDNHLSHQITFKNVKETYVPDTASSSQILFLILGIAITGFGISYIVKNAKA